MSKLYKWATLDNSDIIDISEVDIHQIPAASIVWDLNQFINNHLETEWVKKAILESDSIYIPAYNENKEEWIEKTKAAVAAGKNPETEILFHLASWDLYAIIRRMFLQLDLDAGYEWLGEMSFSKRFLKPGLTISLATIISDGSFEFKFWPPDNTKSYNRKPAEPAVAETTDNPLVFTQSYTQLSWCGRNKWFRNNYPGLPVFSDIAPPLEDSEGNPVYAEYEINRDSFAYEYCWTYNANEQQTTLIEHRLIEYINNGNNKECPTAPLLEQHIKETEAHNIKNTILDTVWAEEPHHGDNNKIYNTIPVLETKIEQLEAKILQLETIINNHLG